MATYSYDNLNQLTRQTTGGQAGEFYEYDSLGNRTSAHTSNIYQYDPLMNHLTEDDTFTYTYDANGNLATKTEKSTHQITTYTYDKVVAK